MKLLLISDRESKFLWDYFQPGMLDEIDLILSCGDLNPHYLSFLVTMGRMPLLYVHGTTRFMKRCRRRAASALKTSW